MKANKKTLPDWAGSLWEEKIIWVSFALGSLVVKGR